VLAVVGIVLAGGALLVAFDLVAAALGAPSAIAAGVMALVPLGIVALGAWWMDRWEPEPRAALLFAFLWGAGVSVLVALVVGAVVDAGIELAGGPNDATEFVGAAVQAPLVEEIAKAFGLLLLVWAARRHFDGPVDGAVYATWIAGGFAFTENVLYFGSEIVEGGDVGMLFFVRGIMSPFAHVMFTVCTGIAIGFAVRRGAGAFGALGAAILGLIPAIGLHALWNAALFVVTDFFGYYFTIQFPLFVGMIVLVLWLRKQEWRLTRERLAEVAAAGWLDVAEIDWLGTPAGRRRAKAWARSVGRTGAMKAYIREAGRVAAARQRILSGRGRERERADELEGLRRLRALREVVAGRPVALG